MAKIPEWRKDNGRFIFHNENPKGLLSAGDCVIRALAFGLSVGLDKIITWDEVYEGLYEIGFELKDVPNSDRVYREFMKRLGFEKRKQPRRMDGSKYTAEEFSEAYYEGTYIISLANHLSVVYDGRIYDTWNCSHKSVGNFWKVEY